MNLFIIYAVVRSTELKTISSAEDTVSNHLIYYVNSIRSRRHDMNNHLQIISGLANTDQIQELNDYIKELGQESFFYSQLMKVDNPFIGALLNAKAVAAEMKNVSLNVQIDVALTDLRGRILEIVRILGNLVDNAIEAAEQNEGEDRWVRVSTYEISPFIAFEVANHGVIEAENTASLFQPGVTSKDKYHSGLGLYSAQELAGKLHGHIQLTTEANQVKFTFLIPK
ncbi:MAG: sensor histidine kinase [Chitinophagales bacterium]